MDEPMPVDSSATKLSPVELLTAFFFRVGNQVVICDDERLHKLFREAANRYPHVLADFHGFSPLWHSQKLAESISTMVLGGTLERVYLHTQIRPVHAFIDFYGRNLYEQLTPEQQEAIDCLVETATGVFSTTASPGYRVLTLPGSMTAEIVFCEPIAASRPFMAVMPN